MDKKDLFTAGIFLIGFLSLLLVSFNSMLDARITPLKEDIQRIESRMESRIDRLDTKLDQLILLQAQQNSQKQNTIPRKHKLKPASRNTSSITH